MIYCLDDADSDTGLNWWRNPGSNDIQTTAVQARFTPGPVFKVRDSADLPPNFNFEIGILPDILSLSGPVPVTISVKFTLEEGEPCTVESHGNGAGNIFAEVLNGFSLVVVESTKNSILSYGRRAEGRITKTKEMIGWKRLEFREFQPRETVEMRREIPVEDIQQFFRDGLQVQSVDSLRSQNVELRLRKSGFTTMRGMLGDKVAIWWTRKSIAELFDGKDVIHSNWREDIHEENNSSFRCIYPIQYYGLRE